MTSSDKSSASVHHLSVRRTARYAMIGETGAHIRDVWIVCHGHAQLAKKFIGRFGVLAAADRLIVAPEALNRYYLDGGFHGPESRVGATWMTAEDRDAEIADYVAYLDDLHDEIFRVVPRAECRLTVLGFSQGVATAARWASAGKVNPDRVILWAGSLPAEISREGAQRLTAGGRPLMIVVGEDDPFITPKVLGAQLDILHSLGVTTSVTRFRGGHEIDPATVSSMAAAD